MEDKLSISIIIPVHNSADTLERCVESLQNEHYDRLEIILVENNSTDESLAVCERLKDKYKNIKLISTKGRGVSAARNIGLNAATGDIIGFVDSDDFTLPGYIDYVMDEFVSDKHPDVIVTGFNRCLPDGSIQGSEIVKGITEVGLYELAQMCLYEASLMGAVWNKYFRRGILEDTYFDTELTHCEDMHFVISALMKHTDKRAVVIDKCFYNYVQNPDSAVMNKARLFDSKGYLKYNRAFDKIILEQSDKLIKDLALRKKCLIESNILLDDIKSEYKEKAFKDIRLHILRLIKLQLSIYPKAMDDFIILIKRIIKYMFLFGR